MLKRLFAALMPTSQVQSYKATASTRSNALTIVNAVLLAAVALAVIRTQLTLRAEASVEASVRRYASAVSNADLTGAMAEIAPDQRATWEDWVRGQLGNVYEVRGIAVRSPSLLARLSGTPSGPVEVTASLDVNRGYPDEFYQPSPRVAIETFEGRPYLAAPLLAREAAETE